MKNVLVLSKQNKNYKDYIVSESRIKFDKIIEIDSKTNINSLIDLLKSFENIYFINFDILYRKILPFIPFSNKCFSIFTYEISELTDRRILDVYNSIMEFYDRTIFKEIYTLSSEVANLLKHSDYKCKNIKFNTKPFKINNNNKNNIIIGVLNDDFNPNNNFYNVLTALTMVKVDKIKLVSNMPATNEFIQRFNLPVIYCKSVDDVLDENNTLNIYTNFTSNKYNILKKSIDQNVPCIIGNIDDSIRKKYDNSLILQSDDNVNELRDIIIKIINNKKFN